jgi:hypothetical protein
MHCNDIRLSVTKCIVSNRNQVLMVHGYDQFNLNRIVSMVIKCKLVISCNLKGIVLNFSKAVITAALTAGEGICMT